jgi:prevent-host-death family protein
MDRLAHLHHHINDIWKVVVRAAHDAIVRSCGIGGKSVYSGTKEFMMSSTVPAAEVSKNFGAYQDAAVRDPVIITKNGRPRTVLMAYEDFMRLTRRDRRVQSTTELDAADIAAVEASSVTVVDDEAVPHAAR